VEVTLNPVAYIPATSLDQAIQALQEGGEFARVLSGGTDVIVQAREGRRNVAMLVDIKNIPEANELKFDPQEGLTLGATVPCYRIYGSEMVQRLYPGLIDSASLIGGVQIQSRASLGGNLCNSSPAADSIPTLIALEATCLIAGAHGTRRVPVEEFCIGPGQNQLQPGELLVSLHFPPPKPRSGARFLRFIPRNEMDIAVANAAVSLTLNERRDTITWGRVAVGAVAPTPLLVPEAGEALAGAPATSEGLAKAVEAAREAARPITDMRGSNAQRRHLVGVLVRRAGEGAIERAKAS
jgi:CO/xanthine dehydrogenase FAD-binding subunit